MNLTQYIRPEAGPAKIGLISDMATYPIIFINKRDPKIRAHNYWPFNRFGLVTDFYMTDMYYTLLDKPAERLSELQCTS